MSSELDDTTRWLVQIGRGRAPYHTTRAFSRFSLAEDFYRLSQVMDGDKKRLIHVLPDGSKHVIMRVIV